MQILDRVRDGVSYPQHIILQALRMTGDLDELWMLRCCEGMRQLWKTVWQFEMRLLRG